MLSQSLTNYHQEQEILLLSIIISEALYKRKLFRYAILIQDFKKQTFSLSHLMKHYLYIYKENYLDGYFKIETFSSKRRSLRIQITTQTQNLFDLTRSSHFKTPYKRF